MPCNSVSVVSTVYRHTKANFRALRKAADQLGLDVVERPDYLCVGRAMIDKKTGALRTTDEAQAGNLMRAYGKAVAASWVTSYPESFEVSENTDISMTVKLKSRR